MTGMVFAIAAEGNDPVFFHTKRARCGRPFGQMHKVQHLSALATRTLLKGPQLQNGKQPLLERQFIYHCISAFRKNDQP